MREVVRAAEGRQSVQKGTLSRLSIHCFVYTRMADEGFHSCRTFTQRKIIDLKEMIVECNMYVFFSLYLS